jgi:hypothetical protein
MPEFVSASGSNVDVFDGLGDSCKCSPTLAAIDNVRLDSRKRRSRACGCAGSSFHQILASVTPTFSTWGNSGIEPDKDTGNQLSRNV